MKTNQIIQVCGSIVKKESLVSIDSQIIPNTSVAEANMPYSNYYGNRPEKSVPNSLFLFTRLFYSLEEILRFTQNINYCFMDNVNVAAAIFNFQTKQFPAIRIKNFPDYEHLEKLQNCYMNQGVELEKKITFDKEALIRIHKCFILEEAENGIFIDKTEKNKAYISIPKPINYEEFEHVIQQIRNNSNCRTFDAVKGTIIFESQLIDLIRIYSEKLDIELLRCIKEKVERLLNQKSPVSYFNVF